MKKHFALVIDGERCIGCEACTVACRMENDTALFWIRVETLGSAHKGVPEGRFPALRMHFVPHLCRHCEDPACVGACPTEALYKRDDGPVVLNPAECNGCQACKGVCPYDALRFNPATAKMEKCSLCVHRIDQGLAPFCVVCCEGQAMHFGDANDPESAVAKMIAGGVSHFDTAADTRLSVYYRPPMAPRKL